MLIEADLMAEGLVADVASEGPLAVVRPACVNFQPVRSREHLLAFHTRKGVASGSAGHSRSAVVVAIQRFRLLCGRVEGKRRASGGQKICMEWKQRMDGWMTESGREDTDSVAEQR